MQLREREMHPDGVARAPCRRAGNFRNHHCRILSLKDNRQHIDIAARFAVGDDAAYLPDLAARAQSDMFGPYASDDALPLSLSKEGHTPRVQLDRPTTSPQ